MKLYAKQLNHGRSEIWVDDGPHRDIATNEVIWAIRKHCSKDQFDSYYASLNEEMGKIVETPATEEMISELRMG